MTVTSLLNQVYPKIGHPFKLKGFLTQDRHASVLKERIKEVTGTYPKTIFGSTETMFSGLPSISHPGRFFFDWRVLWPEFLPEKDAISDDVGLLDPPPQAFPLMEVEVVKRYQMIVMPYLNDLVRYVMPDVVECVDMGDNILGCLSPVLHVLLEVRQPAHPPQLHENNGGRADQGPHRRRDTIRRLHGKGGPRDHMST